MRGLSIRARIALQCGAMVAAVALLTLAVNLMGERALLLRHYRHTLETATELAKDDIHYERGKLEIDRLLENPSRVRLSIYNEDETLLYGKVIITIPFEAGAFRRHEGRDGTDWYVYDARLDIGGDEDLWLRACISADTLAGLLDGQRILLRLMVPVLAGLAGLCGWFIARRIIRPVETMTATAVSIAIWPAVYLWTARKTSFGAWARYTTTCWRGWSNPLSGNAGSTLTPLTSCERPLQPY